MDIQNEEELNFFVEDAYHSYHKNYTWLVLYPPEVLHEVLINNPILHESYVIADVYREFKTLTI